MFNLLPDSLKEKVRSEYHLRLFVVALVSFFIIQIFFLIFLSPTWFISINKEKELLSQAERENKISLDSKIESVNTEIISINTILDVINSTLSYPKIIVLIDDILSKKTKSILIEEMSYSTSGERTANIALSGISATRESLVSFVKNLEESENFEKVDLPISNFTKDKNIDFSINITVSI